MNEEVIKVEGLKKVFKSYKREEGVWNAFKSLFHREYESVEAVKGVNFSVKKGEILGYLGPNGAGKSTVIKMLTGILHPSEGKAKCLDYTPWNEREKYVQYIGVVLGGQSTLEWDLPPVDSYELNKHIYQIPEEQYKKRLKELMQLLEVEDISKTPVRKLSTGQRMRCRVINSLLHKPKIIFLDEPTLGLDVVAKEKFRQIIKQVNKDEKVTIILTTHDISDVEQLCDRIIIIDKGQHIYEGTVDSLKKKYVKYKELIIEFSKQVKKLNIPNTELVKIEGIKAILKVNIKKTSVSTVIKHLIDKYPVNDIDINEQSVESIIRTIYEAKK